MKINEKNLCMFATSPPVDLEGWLSKRGEVNKNYQRRYFVLKGNLLFYFEKKGEKEPLGVIVLEGCTIELAEDGEQYCFQVVFHGINNRTYFLSAESQDLMERWMKALTCAGYEYMKLMVSELQRQLEEIEGTKDATSDKLITPQPPPRRHNPFNRPAPPPPNNVTPFEVEKGVAVPKPLTMLDLNEDCLNQIFESKYVSAMDLVSVAKSCSKLKRISTQIFTKKYNMCNFNDAGVKNLVMAENLLETFGSLISGLCINFAPYGFDGSKIVDAILRFCENLNSLSMASYEIPDTRDDITKITLLFGKVEVLHINDVKIEWPDGCVVDDFVTPNAYVMDIFENCNSLIDLKIENCPTLELVAFGNKFSQLEHIYYAYGGNDVGTGFLDDGYIPAFIMRHRKLKSLRLTEQMRNVQVLCMIPVYCKELENLEFRTETNSDDRFFTFWLASLAQLDRLRELKIVWRGQRVTDMLKEFHRSKSLNVLHLESVKGGLDLLQSLAGIKTLRCVKLVDVELHPFGILTHITGLIEHKTGEIESSFDISKLVDGLPNLRKLKIHCKNYSLTESEYVRLADAVECRVGTDRYLQVDCNTTGDFTNSLRRSVQFKTFVQ